jgi:hypothetical protein
MRSRLHPSQSCSCRYVHVVDARPKTVHISGLSGRRQAALGVPSAGGLVACGGPPWGVAAARHRYQQRGLGPFTAARRPRGGGAACAAVWRLAPPWGVAAARHRYQQRGLGPFTAARRPRGGGAACAAVWRLAPPCRSAVSSWLLRPPWRRAARRSGLRFDVP